METTRLRGSGIILVLFALSGMAALIYEIVWYQMLQLAIGAIAVSLAALLASFMGGLSLGAGLFARLKTNTHPLILYAVIEVGIALCALLVLWLLPLLDQVYFAAVAAGMPSLLTRGALAGLCLLPPTMLMGASLPAIVRFAGKSESGWAWLYACNTLGAMAGALIAAFVLLRHFDVAVASYAGMAINLLVAAASFALAKAVPAWGPADETEQAPAPVTAASQAPRAAVYVVTALSGLTALGAEVVWTRFLGMLFAGTVYAFATILAVFLAGMAIGSFLAAPILKYVRPALALGFCQVLLAGAIAWAAYASTQILPFMPVLGSNDGWTIATGDFLRASIALLPATLLWGASFPFGMAAVKGNGNDPAKPVSRIYVFNTLGGIAGALLVSLVLVVAIGSQNVQRLMLGLTALGGISLLALEIRPAALRLGGAVAAAALAVALVWTLPPLPASVVAYGPDAALYAHELKPLALVEGINSSVSINKRSDDGIIEISVAGHVEASNQINDMRLQRMVGHLPALLHPHPVKVLGIGFGAGVSAGTFTRYPSIKSITVAEIEPAIPPTSNKFFGPYDNHVYTDPRTRIVYDDARHYMMTTKETYDIIAQDPLDVWVKGTASIYTKEFFQKARDHLNPGGYFTLYVPLYQADQAVIKSELETFFQVFPNGTIWGNTQQGGLGYDMVAMGQKEPLKIDISKVQEKLNRPEFAEVTASLRDIGFSSAFDLFGTYAGQKSDLTGWLKGAQVNSDRNLRLMYLAGWAYNDDLANPIYQEIMAVRRPPENIFNGDSGDLAALYGVMADRSTDPGLGRSGASE
jgi:spermidine synthase